MIRRVKGTQDFLDLTLFNFLIDHIKKHLKNYNFNEIATPLIEHTELFKRSLGAETDVITKEMYLVTTEHNPDDKSLCLRPEATASTVRAFVDNNIDQTPWKVFSWGPMFRHERPQKGRYRQFHQVNIETIGIMSPFYDAYFIKMLEKFFSEVLNFDNYALLVNFLGCPRDRENYKALLYGYLKAHEDALCSQCVVRKEKNILRILDCKNSTCQSLYKDAPLLAANLCMVCDQEWNLLQNELQHLSVSYTYCPTLVRGLDYYDKTVFEFVSLDLGAQNAFCGGGRYNQLVKQIGGKNDQACIGAAFGVERVILMLEAIKDKLILKKKPLTVIIPLSDQQNSLALLLADKLHSAGLKCDIILDSNSIKSMMRKADKLQADYVALVGSVEQGNQTVSLKTMQSGDTQVVQQGDLVNYLKNIIQF